MGDPGFFHILKEPVVHCLAEAKSRPLDGIEESWKLTSMENIKMAFRSQGEFNTRNRLPEQIVSACTTN